MAFSQRDIYQLYRRAPAPLKAAGDALYRFIPERFLRSRQTRKKLALLEDMQWWDDERRDAWRLEKLRHLLIHAGTHVPYYRELFRELDFTPEEISGLADIAVLPVLTIDMVRELGDRLLPENLDRHDTYISASSGSTGRYIELRRDSSYYAWEQAFLLRYMRWHGVKLHWRYAIFYSAIMDAPVTSDDHPPYERFRNRLILSQFHTDDRSIDFYCDLLADFRPDHLTVSPNILLLFTRRCRRRGIAPPFVPRFFLCSAENLYEEHRREMEEYWGCPVYDRYGHNEGCVSAAECPEKGFHLSTELGHAEFLREDGTPAAPGEAARVIATGFFTHAMPLIRYDTRDIGRYSDARCSCGRTLPLLDAIDGRADDVILTHDGRPISAMRAVFSRTAGIRLTQIVQEVPGEIVIRIVPDEHYDERVKDVILGNLHRDIGEGVLDVRFELVEDVERAPSGKVRLVRSYVEEREDR